jgi:hypothetical protein
MTNVEFFYAQAGYSMAGAKALADAEQWAEDEGLIYRWVYDTDTTEDDFDFPDDKEHVRKHGAVGCILVKPCKLCSEFLVSKAEECRHDEVLASLWGITESLNNRDRDNYRRMVQAELALEVIGRERTR